MKHIIPYSVVLTILVNRCLSLLKAARDNSLSRIYAGYHFRHACLVGEEHETTVATYIFHINLPEYDKDDD